VQNLYIRSLRSIPEIFGNTEWKGAGWENHLYRPFTTLTYALNYAVSGLAPWSYHLVNVLLHATVSALVFLLGLRWRLAVSAAGLGALLFALHPVHVEAVANITGRKELLAAAFLLVMVLAHGSAVRRGGLWLLVPAAAYAAAMLSKEIGVTGIVLVAAQELVLPEEGGEPKARQHRGGMLFVLYVALLFAFLLLRSRVTGLFEVPVIPFVDNPIAAASPLVRWTTGVAVLGKGLLLLLIPVRQSPDYSFDAIPVVETLADPRFLMSSLLLIIWVVAGIRTRRRHPVVLLSGVWYGVTILPAANLLFPTGVLFAERLLYVPSVGFFLVVACAVWQLASTRIRPVVATLTVLVLCGSGLATIRYAAAWRDPVTLFGWGTRSQPASSKVHQLLGASLLEEEPLQAAESFSRSLEIWPENYKSLYGLYKSYAAMGSDDLAKSTLARARPIRRATADENYTIGQMLRDAGELAEAESRWAATVEVEPRHSGAWADLGTLALMRRDTAEARTRLERAVELDPTMASAWYNLGILYRDLGAAEASQEALREFLATAGPDYDDARSQVEGWLQKEP
jgi:Tfp pilus assembly protein PilF